MSATKISAEERDALLAADLRNVMEKVAAGAVLTARERELITKSTRPEPEADEAPEAGAESQPSTPTEAAEPEPQTTATPRESWPKYATGFDELSAILGTNQRQWRTYAKRAGFPAKIAGKGYEVAACADWKAENVKTQSPGDLAAEKVAKIRLETKLLELRIAKEKRLSVPRSEVDQLHQKMAMKLRAFLYSKLENELPPKMAGQDALALRKAGREIADEIVTRLQLDVDSWDAQ